LNLIFILIVFLARFLKIKDKQALLSLFLKVLNGNNKEVNSKVVDGKVAYSKDVGNGKASSKKVGGFLADFTLFLLLLSIKSYKERFSVYFLKSY